MVHLYIDINIMVTLLHQVGEGYIYYAEQHLYKQP